MRCKYGVGLAATVYCGLVLTKCLCQLQQVEQVRKLDAHGSVPYVAEALTRLREEVGNQSTVLGFVGAPFTLATYIVEGGSSKNYTHMKRLMFTQPEVLHAFLTKMADNVADYVRYQVMQTVNALWILIAAMAVHAQADLHWCWLMCITSFCTYDRCLHTG